MDKVDPSAAALNAPFYSDLRSSVKKARDKGELQGKGKLKFREILENFAPADLGPLRELAPSEDAFTELMDAVHSAGSDLRDRPFPDEILRYKRAVRNFVHYVVENSYDVQIDQGIPIKTVIRGETRWNRKVFRQVQVIDQKLEELAATILSGQTDQLERVSKLDEIKGLLVDLTVSGAIREKDG